MRTGGQWVLAELETGIERPFGLCPKEEAIRRAARFLKNRREKSSLLIYSATGEIQSERVYEGLKNGK